MLTKFPNALSKFRKHKINLIFVRRMSKKLFEEADHAKSYAQYRPTYPGTVYKTLIDYYKVSLDEFGLALDIGCGSGQSTEPLKQYFDRVIGVDISDNQIKHAKEKHVGIEFRVGPAEELSFLDDGCVDLITVAQAMHWLNHERFYKEVDRVLKPAGVVALYGYGVPKETNEEAHKFVSHVSILLSILVIHNCKFRS